MNAAILHGCYRLLIGYLIRRSLFLPRILGALMILAGLLWLFDLSAPRVDQISPYNTALGLLGEALPMLWLLVMGIHVEPLSAPAGAVQECQ